MILIWKRAQSGNVKYVMVVKVSIISAVGANEIAAATAGFGVPAQIVGVAGEAAEELKELIKNCLDDE
jgi:hypothetical protein